MKTTFTLAALLAATISMARRLPQDNCCTVWSSPYFMSTKRTYCLEEARTDAFKIEIFNDVWRDGSIKCGKNVDALICPNGFDYGGIDGQREFGYKCESDTIFVEHNTDAVLPGEQMKYIPLQKSGQSMVLSLHPWVAKGEQYLNLDRDEKENILWKKITEDKNINENRSLAFFDIDLAGVFDEFGDEFDCRPKTAHPQGNVGKAEWRSKGDHPYTGIFQGADTGFVRLSTQNPVLQPQDRESDEQSVMVATISLKFLRDGVDSANSLANQNIFGQKSYNFFAESLFTNLKESGFENEDLAGSISEAIRPVTNFVASLGNSDMALWTQDGDKVDNPIFPYSIRYQPNPDLSYVDEEYNKTVFEHISEIPEDTVLYTVFAMDKPSTLGGKEMEIGEIVLRSQMQTSMWGDTHMYFRHQKHDDDFRYHPEWMNESTHGTFVMEGENVKLHPYQEKRASSCPFQWLFEML